MRQRESRREKEMRVGGSVEKKRENDNLRETDDNISEKTQIMWKKVMKK